MEIQKPVKHMSKSNSASSLYFNKPKYNQNIQNPFPEQNFFYSSKFENLHELNKKRLGFLFAKDEDKRQIIRKKNDNISNHLYNYYFPKFHKRSWWPNGEYIIKRRYKYTGIGLEHIYEKNNVEQLKTIENNEKKLKKEADYLKDFPEYDNLKQNQYIITIEHCSSCEEHKNITQHQSETFFRELAINYKKIIQERFPFIKVFLKPIEVEIVKNEKFKLPKVIKNGGGYPPYPNLNSKFKQCRIGAFEIQIGTLNDKNEKVIRIIHSKLKTKQFPEVNTVLNKIVSFMPKFNLKLVLYDKEDYEELEKMDNIQVNIYLCNSSLIKEVGNNTKEQVLNFTSPGRRLLMLKEQRLKQGQNFYRNDTLLKNNNSSINNKNNISTSSPRITSAIPKKVRGLSANKSTSFLLRPSSTTNFNKNKNLIDSSKFKLLGNNLALSSINGTERFSNTYESFFKKGKEIFNQKLLKSQRGALIKRKFSKIDENKLKIENSENNNKEYEESSESVTIYFDELPYDTYIIETIENCNFQGSLTLLKFNELNSEKNGFVTKFIGLWHQENAILNIHLYTEEENKNNDNNNDENGKIRLEQEPILTGCINISNADDPNSKYKVHPNKQGIYEYKTLPGEYKLEIYNENYEKIVMKILLKCGLNTMNIKLKKEKCCDLKIQVLKYNEYSYGNNNNYYYSANYFNHLNSNNKGNNIEISKENEQLQENDMNKNVSEENIFFEPVGNAEIQIFKNSDELVVEGITNRKGFMKYLVEKNENNLSIKVNKNGYFRTERFFKKNSNMNENEEGNYECTMTFILVKIETLLKLNKILFISYSNICEKIFEFDIQNSDEERNKFQIKDMQEENGIFLAGFWYENRPRENDEILLKENADENKQDNINENENVDLNENNNEDIEDFSETKYFEEIVRLGFNIYTESLIDNKNIYKEKNINENDLIEYLRNMCCEGNIYTPYYDFHINLPKFLSKNIITKKFGQVEENNEDNGINNKINITNNRNNKINSINIQQVNFEGIYWDLGWVDVKNYLYYETSVYFNIEYKPERLIFFENFIDFLQVIIDKRLCDSLFTFFGFDISILVSGDRYLPKNNFESKLKQILNEEIKNNEKEKEIQIFIQFICNILCGYDEDNNITDDSISFLLLKKKISSNLQNFANYSSDGKREIIINENKNEITEE